MHPTNSHRSLVMGLALLSTVGLSGGCIASRKFVRNQVQTSADELNARIEQTDSNFKEMNDRVSNLDSRANEHGRRLDSLNGDLQKTSERASQAQSAAEKAESAAEKAQSAVEKAQSIADQARGRVVTLDKEFQNRNQYTVVAEKSVLFGFASSKLDTTYTSVLDEVVHMVSQNPDALIVLEGRTDSRGNEAYNIQLGERRAEAVKRYLVVEKDVPVYRIHQMSFGAARPIADNSLREGREKNRAAAVLVLVPRFSTTAASNASK